MKQSFARFASRPWAPLQRIALKHWNRNAPHSTSACRTGSASARQFCQTVRCLKPIVNARSKHCVHSNSMTPSWCGCAPLSAFTTTARPDAFTTQESGRVCCTLLARKDFPGQPNRQQHQRTGNDTEQDIHQDRHDKMQVIRGKGAWRELLHHPLHTMMCTRQAVHENDAAH